MTKQIERRWNLRFYPLYSALSAGEQDAALTAKRPAPRYRIDQRRRDIYYH